MERNEEQIKKFVKKFYGSLAKGKGKSCCLPRAAVSSSCCQQDVISCQTQTAVEKLYTDEELETLPRDIRNMALGCGNPTAIAGLSDGEVVLDLGSGGGIDCFLAAQKVGKRGRVIGLDMTPEMIQLARENAQKMGTSNAEFRLGEMEHMPVDDNSVDVIISNCVINLSPDKDAVFREAFSVLKPGGRLCISDIVLLEELPKEIKESPEQWAGCIAGALNENIYLDKIHAAGFVKVTVDRNPVTFCTENDAPQAQKELQTYAKLSGKIASIKVRAFKPSKL